MVLNARVPALLLGLLLAAGSVAAHADDNGGAAGTNVDSGESDPDHDHDVARELYEHGEIHSLPEVLQSLDKAIAGDVIAITLEHRDNRWIYDLTIVTTDGQRQKVAIDATSLAVVGKKVGP